MEHLISNIWLAGFLSELCHISAGLLCALGVYRLMQTILSRYSLGIRHYGVFCISLCLFCWSGAFLLHRGLDCVQVWF